MIDNDLNASHILLNSVFDAGPTTDLDYLVWLYQDNPSGQKIQSNLDDDEGRVGHYTVVPQPYCHQGKPSKVALSLNTAVAPRGRGQGLFTRLANDVISQAQSSGFDGIIGVANDNSTPGFVRKLGFELVQPLPVKLGMVIPKIYSGAMTGDQAKKQILALDSAAQTDDYTLSPMFDEAYLDWRLARPGAKYHLFASEHAGVIVSETEKLGQAFLVIVATFAAKKDTKISRLIAHAGAVLGIKLFVYSGWNHNTSISGLPVPKKYRPSPLNMVWCPLSGRVDALSKINIRRFEFIDFDAY